MNQNEPAYPVGSNGLEVRVTRLTVVPKGEAIFDERAYDVSIDDEAAGEFVVIEQKLTKHLDNKIMIDPSEWPTLRDTIDFMFSQTRKQT